VKGCNVNLHHDSIWQVKSVPNRLGKNESEPSEKCQDVVSAGRQTAAFAQETPVSGFLPKAATPVLQRPQFDSVRLAEDAAMIIGLRQETGWVPWKRHAGKDKR